MPLGEEKANKGNLTKDINSGSENSIQHFSGLLLNMFLEESLFKNSLFCVLAIIHRTKRFKTLNDVTIFFYQFHMHQQFTLDLTDLRRSAFFFIFIYLLLFLF